MYVVPVLISPVSVQPCDRCDLSELRRCLQLETLVDPAVQHVHLQSDAEGREVRVTLFMRSASQQNAETAALGVCRRILSELAAWRRCRWRVQVEGRREY